LSIQIQLKLIKNAENHLMLWPAAVVFKRQARKSIDLPLGFHLYTFSIANQAKMSTSAPGILFFFFKKNSGIGGFLF